VAKRAGRKGDVSRARRGTGIDARSSMLNTLSRLLNPGASGTGKLMIRKITWIDAQQSSRAAALAALLLGACEKPARVEQQATPAPTAAAPSATPAPKPPATPDSDPTSMAETAAPAPESGAVAGTDAPPAEPIPIVTVSSAYAPEGVFFLLQPISIPMKMAFSASSLALQSQSWRAASIWLKARKWSSRQTRSPMKSGSPSSPLRRIRLLRHGCARC
jgi:hypothetical protein